MILPTKHVLPRNSLLGAGAILLKFMEQPMTVSALWQKAKQRREIGNYQRFVLAINLLFLLGAVDYQRGLIVRSKA
jgi:hypothetical protein